MEKRLLLAFVLSALIFTVWAVLFPPPHPTVPAVRRAGAGGASATPSPAAGSATPVAGGTQLEATPAAGSAASEPVPLEVASAAAEERFHLTNDVLQVELSNRGAAITSLVLNKYTGDEGEPLELIQVLDHPARALPLQLVLGDQIDTALYRASSVERGVRFRWSDGRGTAVEKLVVLPESGYAIRVEVATRGGGEGWALSAGTGMRNTSATERENRFSAWGDASVGQAGNVERIRRDKLKVPRTFPGEAVTFAGFADSYFLGLLRPQSPVAGVTVVPLEYQEAGKGGEKAQQRALRVALELKGERFAGDLLAAPKEYDLLQRIGGGVEKTLNFGMFQLISVVFLKALRWIHVWVGNWGVAIILLTLGIRLALFPLMHSSTVSMRKMQRLQPKVKVIQEKYKKQKSDPRARAKMNQEMMDLYKAEGINPMGGCLPMLVQLPLLWALYNLFAYAIELRHAPFMLWIHDLSARDPYYVTPILMTASMWLQQRLAPQVGDPQQQRIFRFMPLIFGVMFIGFPSGLVLYWLCNNLITIVQQEVTFRLIGERRSRQSERKGQGR